MSLYQVVPTHRGNAFVLVDDEIDVSNLTLEQVNASISEIEKKEHEAELELAKDIGPHIDAIISILGNKHNVSMYLWKFHTPEVRSKNISRLYERRRQLMVEQERVAMDKKKEEDENFLSRAIQYCFDHGKRLGQDVFVSSAIATANEIAFDLLITEQMHKSEFISFEGNDNCENCRGWDMHSHRCDCGNRRVGWDHEGTFEDMYIYAVAN